MSECVAGESLKPSPGDRAQGSTHYSAPWQQVLEVLQLPVNRVLPGDRLYLFELDRELECLPRLILQASTSEMPRESRIRLPVGALGLLEESARTPLVVSSEDPLPELESLVEFIVQEGCVLVQREMEKCPFPIRHYSGHDSGILGHVCSLNCGALDSVRLCARLLLWRATASFRLRSAKMTGSRPSSLSLGVT